MPNAGFALACVGRGGSFFEVTITETGCALP